MREVSDYTEAMAEVAEQWTAEVQRILEDDFGMKPKPEELRAAFEMAMSTGTIAAFEQQYGTASVNHQISQALRRGRQP